MGQILDIMRLLLFLTMVVVFQLCRRVFLLRKMQSQLLRGKIP